jgi:hypothetical protein
MMHEDREKFAEQFQNLVDEGKQLGIENEQLKQTVEDLKTEINAEKLKNERLNIFEDIADDDGKEFHTVAIRSSVIYKRLQARSLRQFGSAHGFQLGRIVEACLDHCLGHNWGKMQRNYFTQVNEDEAAEMGKRRAS